LKPIKEITVFAIGDSNALKTWSNVPYFFTKSLEEKHIIVNRVNIEENPVLNVIYKYTVFIFLKLINKNSNHTYFRSGLNYFLTNRKIKAAIKQYPHADALLFLTYSFSVEKQIGKKVILFSDWSYLYYIYNFLKREPLWFEQRTLAREKKHIEQADTVLSLFPKSLEFNKIHYNNPHLYYLGNVINGNYPLNSVQLIDQKLTSNKLLFIGNKKYIQGALNLISTFKSLLQTGVQAELHIIGIKETQTGIKLPGLFYYGYLDKGIPTENEQYYKLISETKVIINTNPDWGAFSAMTEAMYYFTPVITTAYAEFTETYGNDIDFGYYVSDQSEEELIRKIASVLNHSSDKQTELMRNAHQKVKDFTWSAYTNKVLQLISE
jgi:glycosyltransferase involved in cell wall biosynthesis